MKNICFFDTFIWIWVLVEGAVVSYVIKNFLLLCNPKVRYGRYKTPTEMVLIFNKINIVYIFTPSFLKPVLILSNQMISFFRLSNKKCIHVSHLFHACYMAGRKVHNNNYNYHTSRTFNPVFYTSQFCRLTLYLQESFGNYVSFLVKLSIIRYFTHKCVCGLRFVTE